MQIVYPVADTRSDSDRPAGQVAELPGNEKVDGRELGLAVDLTHADEPIQQLRRVGQVHGRR